LVTELKKIIPDRIKKKIRSALHKGNKYICPLCNYSAKDLFPIGLDFPVLKEKQVIGGGRRYGGCYCCRSTERERLIYAYLKDKIDLFNPDKNKKILHIAPEKSLSKILFDFGFKDYVCGDLFTEGYIYPKYVKNINVLNIPYDNDTFDLIICNHVLEHIPEDVAAMKELRRVLKNEGQAILQVPISNISESTFEDFSITNPKDREIIFGQFDHVRIYGLDYIERLAQSGFKVSRINIANEYQKYGLNKDEDLFVCEK